MTITVPGEPVAQGRPRASIVNGHVHMRDPDKSRSWKGAAQVHMKQAWGDTAPHRTPVSVHIVAIFTCPRTQHRKRSPLPRRYHDKRPDAENVGKCVLDAASGICFYDDSQVAHLVIEKYVGAQGEAPGVTITVTPLPEEVKP